MLLRTTLIRSTALGLGLLALAPACDHSTQVAETVSAPAAPKPEPTDAAALERSRLYWANAQKKDWIPNYALLSSELRERQPVGDWLASKSHHIYENMKVTEVVGRQDDLIFLRVTGRWTPDHPMARQVKLEPGQSLTQDVELIEAWRWERSAWFLHLPLRPDEFLVEFPEVARGGTPAPAK